MKKRKKSNTPERTVVTVITQFWKPLSTVENGSVEEREKLMDKFFKEVIMKNDKIVTLNKNFTKMTTEKCICLFFQKNN